MKKRRGVLKEWHMDVPRNNSSLLLLIFFRANEALIRACKSFSVQHTCSNGDLNAKEGIIPLCIFRYDFVFFFFFLSFSFFISKAKRIYQIHLWNCSRPKNVSPRIETLGLARHATIFSSFSLIIFYFDQREKCLIRRGTKKRTEERNPDEKVWQEFKNQPLCPVVGATVSSKFLINLLWLSFWKHEIFFHLDPSCQESIVEWIVSGRGFLWPNFFSRGLSSMFLCKTL